MNREYEKGVRERAKAAAAATRQGRAVGAAVARGSLRRDVAASSDEETVALARPVHAGVASPTGSEGADQDCAVTEVASDDDVVALPITRGGDLAEALKGAAETERVKQEEATALLTRVDSKAASLIATYGVPLEALLSSMSVDSVDFAEGDSDADSVRDYDSGPGPFRWSRSAPYAYRRERNLENVQYRRRMKLECREEGKGLLGGFQRSKATTRRGMCVRPLLRRPLKWR
jgi:hypothetical protein